MKLASCLTTKMLALAAGMFFLAFGTTINAQVQTTTSTTSGKVTKTVNVDRGTVVLVEGNDLIVETSDGTIRHFPNVPDSTKFNIDGKSLSIHDLKPGMKLQRTITTTSTPQVVKTVQTVTGTVWYVSPPNSVILTLANGKNQSFKIPKNQQFDINGKMFDAFGLRKGMKITATRITETPETIVSQQRSIRGTAPAPAPRQVAATPPPPPPPADVPILIAVLVPEPATLPKTGSELPLIALLGLLCLSFSLALKFVRTNEAR